MQHHTIPGPAGRLEAVSTEPLNNKVDDAGSRTVVVIAHPHPLYGGTMDNAVVTATAHAANTSGAHAMRFNFRGTGRSEGVHDQGKGEILDLAAALAWSQEQFQPESVWLAGYSFGAATIMRSKALAGIKGALLIAPPLSVYEFDPSMSGLFASIPTAVICGANDDFTDTQYRHRLNPFDPVLVTEVADVGHDLGTAAGSIAPLGAALKEAITALKTANATSESTADS